MESTVKSPALTMRVMKYAFVASAFLFIFVAIKVPVQPGPPPNETFQMAIAAVAIMSLVAGFFLPQMIAQVAQSSSATAELQRWFTKGVLSLAFFEACILFGLVLHFLHGSVRLVGFLFAAGIVAELIWNPGEPPGAEDEQSARR
jgi:F0F1-type ATP synthase membrane subunit c/vacuolar-type H+-ATPase subunit K